jgi:hypothetical protein
VASWSDYVHQQDVWDPNNMHVAQVAQQQAGYHSRRSTSLLLRHHPQTQVLHHQQLLQAGTAV